MIQCVMFPQYCLEKMIVHWALRMKLMLDLMFFSVGIGTRENL